jgi:DNA mismatch repair protein MutS
MTATPPLRKQYLTIKRRHQDAILLFRIGDFYEAFDDDARLVARELNITLTSKPMGKNLRVPLAGIPHHSLDRHLATLIERGHRIAICEQLTTEPTRGEGQPGRGLIERGVVRIVTPGTISEPGLLHSRVNNYLAAYTTDGAMSGIAYADITTGDFYVTELERPQAEEELLRIGPSELLLPRSFEAKEFPYRGFITRRDDAEFAAVPARLMLLDHFQTRTLEPMGCEQWPLATAAAGALVAYLRDTQPAAAGQLTRLTSYRTASFMTLDPQTLRSLEILESADQSPSLLRILDRSRTAMGGRLLRRWLKQPLRDPAEILSRQSHVAWFLAHAKERAELFSALEGMNDLERLIGRVRSASASARELLALGQSLSLIPQVRSILQRDAARFGSLLTMLPSCEAAARLIDRAIADQPPRGAPRQLIRDGFAEELDRLREVLRDGKKYLAEIEQRERARTGIKSLRVGYNKVFGYYIEVTRPNLHLVPQDYTRKQTLTQAERFITLELKEHEAMVVNAQERIAELEASLFRRVCSDVSKERREILGAASTIAFLDTVAALADVAAEYNYARPTITEDAELTIKDGRHPIVERQLPAGTFVPNDVAMGGANEPQILLVTGPNMSGKSTYLRQTAMIVIMAQIGSFVPASEARIGICDRIFTRAGLYDRIGRGESTFMTEMIETAAILHHATPRSLILLDELGRGTSTYDGLAVARAVLEYIHNHPKVRARTLFATHYHELTELDQVLPRVRNLHVEIVEHEGELIFLHKITPGCAERSYGVYAAKLAGMPRPVVRRAEQLLGDYEARSSARGKGTSGHSLRGAPASGADLLQALREIDPDTLSPVEALMKLYDLKQRACAEADKDKNSAPRPSRTNAATTSHQK